MVHGPIGPIIFICMDLKSQIYPNLKTSIRLHQVPLLILYQIVSRITCSKLYPKYTYKYLYKSYRTTDQNRKLSKYIKALERSQLVWSDRTTHF